MTIKERFAQFSESKLVVKLLPILKNKYVFTSLAFILWVAFIDENNLIERIGLHSELDEIEESQQFYRDKIEIDRYEMEELDNNDKLERLAREKYMMKQNNEDVFVIIEKED